MEKSKLITQNRQSTETIQKSLEKLTSEQNAKFTTYDAFKKQISTPLKNLETFDSATTENKIKSLEQAEKSLSSQVTTLRKQMMSLKSYANSVSPQKDTCAANSTDDANINVTLRNQYELNKDNSAKSKCNKTTTHLSSGAANVDSLFESIKTKSDLQVSNRKPEPEILSTQHKQTLKTTESIDDLITQNLSKINQLSDTTSNSLSPKHTRADDLSGDCQGDYSLPHDNKSPRNSEPLKSPSVTVDLTSPNRPQTSKTPPNMFRGSTQTKPKSVEKTSNKTPKTQEPKTFKGVTRKNTIRYYIGHIDSSSTYSGLIEFLEEQQLTPTMLYLFKTRNGELAARVNIPSDQQEIIESDDIPWPEGVIVNKWMSKHQLNQQRNAKRERPKKRYNGTDYYDHTDSTDKNEDVLRVHTDLNNKVRQVTYRPTWYSSTYYDQCDSYDGYQNDYEIDY